MALHDKPFLFDFEVVSSENLTFIPMSVRFHLDRFGLRISLDAWQKLPLEKRALLARFSIDDVIDVSDGDSAIEPNFAHVLINMMHSHVGVEPARFLPDDAPAWRNTEVVLPSVIHQSHVAGLAPPTLECWARLDPFKRYVLAKLSRKPEANHDFVPAMKAFGLAP
jgi:hypothetical protein